jgi:AcrR family transcriptional regulator
MSSKLVEDAGNAQGGVDVTISASATGRRVDARRNRDRLVAAAAAVFAEEGVDAPLDKVARAAGIGNATMYRNFPTREALIEAVLHDVHEKLAVRAEQLLDVRPASHGVAEWLRVFTEYTQSYLGLPEPIMATMYDETSALSASCRAMVTMAARLLSGAQEAGELRADVTALDLCAHALGIAWATQRAPDKEQQNARLLAVLMDGIRT